MPSDQTTPGDQAFRATALKGRQPEATFAGALSFLRRKYTRDLTGADIAVTGIPFDQATTFRPGARLGPAAIRAASVQLAELPAFPWGFDPLERLAVVDYGDCFLDIGHPQRVPAAVKAHSAEILAAGVKPLSFGGDHFVSYPILEAVAERHGPVALVHFDAHPDTWDDDGEPLNHGTMFTRAVNRGLIDPARSIQIGIRTITDDTRGLEIVDAPFVHARGPEAVIDRVLARVGTSKAYLTFDIDCLDPAYAPGTGTPVAGGLSTAQALAILRGLGAIDWVGMDVVEVSPPFDHAEITALAAATLAHDWICLEAAKHG
ncbi:MAG: agmatinase [Alphaproteobacteria bacterium]|nr:agmatinase [Alphaproteobacteria bacterium]